MKIRYVLFFVLFLIPTFARAEIIISEIAWMGTNASANEEWIELQNIGSNTVSLSGWGVFKAGGDTQIRSLSGSLSSGQYLLVCRTTPTVTNPLSGICGINGTFGGGGLVNTGEHIVLKDSLGTIIQNLNFSSGWPAGDNSTKQTMQWTGSSWITANPTPGSQNSTSGSTGSGGSQNQNNNNGDDEDEEEEDISSSKKNIVYSKIVKIKTIDNTVPLGSPVKFYLDTRDRNGSNIFRGQFFFNMGDGTELYFSKNEKFEHTYDHEGTYIVTLKYYSTYFEGIDPEITDKITVNITKPGMTVSKIHLDGSIEIRNSNGKEIDLSDWFLRDNFGKVFKIPKDTYIPANKTIVFNSKRTGINSNFVALFNPSGGLVSYLDNLGTDVFVQNIKPTNQSRVGNNAPTPPNQLTLNEEAPKVLDLSDLLQANVNSTKNNISIWIVLFIILILGSGTAVYLLHRQNSKKDSIEEEDFDLID